jgi:hypothetical protein
LHLAVPVGQEQRKQAEPAVALVDAEEKQADLGHVALAEEEADQALRKEPAVGTLQRLIDVRHRDDARDHLAVYLGTDRATGIEDRLQLLRDSPELRDRWRHEPPVPFPRGAVDGAQAFDLARELAEIERPDGDSVLVAQPMRGPLEGGRKVTLKHVYPREQILDLAVTGRFDLRAVFWRIVRHEEHRVGIEAVDQDAAHFVHDGLIGPRTRVRPRAPAHCSTALSRARAASASAASKNPNIATLSACAS